KLVCIQRNLLMTSTPSRERGSREKYILNVLFELAQPVARLQEVGIQTSFGRTRLGRPVVLPAHQWRQRHQDRFGATAGLQSERRAAVVHQVEFDVAAAAVQLELSFTFAMRMIL